MPHTYFMEFCKLTTYSLWTGQLKGMGGAVSITDCSVGIIIRLRRHLVIQ